jgi:hypothetical protein
MSSMWVVKHKNCIDIYVIKYVFLPRYVLKVNRELFLSNDVNSAASVLGDASWNAYKYYNFGYNALYRWEMVLRMII